MNQKFVISFAALLAIATFAAPAAHAAPYSYRLKVPASSATCADHAGSVAATFAIGSRAKVVTGTCESRQTVTENNTAFAVDVIVVNYQAESELTPERSVFGANAYLNAGDATAGVFATYSECLSQLAIQQPIFAQETGVTPFAGYCTASTQQEFFPGYSLTFESFGELSRHLYTYAEDGVSTPGDDNSQVIRAAYFAIQSVGGDIVFNDDKRVFYYGAGDARVSAENFGIFEVPSQCSSQTASALGIYKAGGLSGVTAFCKTSTPVAGHSFSILMVVGAGGNEISDMESGHYGDFDECMGDLNRVIKNAASAGNAVLGGLCLPGATQSNGFDAHVYSSYL